jgi:hypothetical protein
MEPHHAVGVGEQAMAGTNKPGALKIERKCDLLKVDESLGIVFGFALVSKVQGERYFDSQGDHIPEDSLMRASLDFAENSRISKEMHRKDSEEGSVLFIFPMTTEVAKSLGIETMMTGLLIGMKPPKDVFEKFKDGTYSGFSIGGEYVESEEVE